MKYLSLDTETEDKYLKDHGAIKARGTSCVFGRGRVIVIGTYDGKQKKSYDGNGGAYIKNLFLNPNVTIIGANIQYDAVWLILKHNINPKDVKCHFIDISVVESLIDEYQKYDLDSLALKYLDEHKGKSVLESICQRLGLHGDFREHLGDLWDKGYKQEIRDYVESDADQPWRIWEKQKPILEAQGLMRAFEMNMEMLPVTIFMKVRGAKFDFDKWQKNCAKAGEPYNQLKSDYDRNYGEVNINSPKQLAEQMDRFDVPYRCKINIKGWKVTGRKFRNATDLFSDEEVMRQKKALKDVFGGLQIVKDSERRKRLVLFVPKRYATRTTAQISAMGYEVSCNPCINKAFYTEFAGSYQIVADLVQYKQAKNIIDKFLGPKFGRFIVAHYADGSRSPAFDDNGEFIGEGAVDYRIHSTFNVVGARQTGRLSSSQCNNQQIPSKTILFEKTDHEVNLAKMCRECFIAEKGHAFVKFDYSAQENRLAAHFAPGKNGERIRKMYSENPFLDEHAYVTDVSGLAEKHGKKAGRKYAKNLRFGVCLSSDSLYMTSGGAYTGKVIASEKKPLLDLNGNVQDYKSYLFHSNGLEFELSNGVKFVSTTEHLFIDCESIEWKTKRACEMKVGDRVPLAHLAPCQGSEWTLEGIKLDLGMAYLAGLYLGDGHINSGVELITHKDNTDHVLEVLSAHDIHYTLKEEAEINRVYLKQSEGVRTQRFFMNFGVGCENKFVPDFIFSASYGVQLCFLAGLIDSDGCITKYSARIMNCNETLMRGVAKLCAILGMSAHWCMCHHKEAEKKDEYVLDIHDTAGYHIPVVYRTREWQQNSDYCGWNIPKEQLEKFRTPDLYKTNVYLYDYLRGKRGLYEHNSWLPEGIWQKDYSSAAIVSIRPVEDAEFTFIETDSHYYVANGFATHNCYGMQIPRMMTQFGWTQEFAEDLYKKVSEAAPWLFELMEQVQDVVIKRRYIKTLVGRRVHMRPGKDKDAYKFMNYLIQGSASDMTKLATVAVFAGMKKAWEAEQTTIDEMAITVHDEDDFDIDCTDVEKAVKRTMEIRNCMENTSGCDLPIISCPEIGTSWADGVEWEPSLGDCEDFVRRAYTAIHNGTFPAFKKRVAQYSSREEDDGLTFAQFCFQVDEDEAEENAENIA